MTNLARYLVSHDHAGRLIYRFPNGQEASVIPDPAVPLRWELLADAGNGTAESSLTTAEAEVRLAELAALPMPEWNGAS